MIIRLKLLILIESICLDNYYIVTNDSYYKAYLIKVVKVTILNVILYTYINYQPKSHIYLIRIFIKDFLKVIHIQKTRLKLRTALYKVVQPLLADRLCVMRLVKKISYILYVVDIKRESSRIQIKNILYKCLFFNQNQIMLNIGFFGFRSTVLYLIAEADLKNIICLYSMSDRHFLIYINSLNDKKNSGFLELRPYFIIVLQLCTMIKRLRYKRKVRQTLVCARRL